jgi:predicted kinase
MRYQVKAFKEDTAPQIILLMGLPAAGKSTFVKKHLTRYYQHRMPHIGAFQVLNSDVQLRRMQYERAARDFVALRQVKDEEEWAKRTAEMAYESNDGAVVPFPLKQTEFQRFGKVDDFWRAMYKPYYATYFGDRAKAKKSTDELADRKIGKGDVVILDSTGVNTSKMLGYFKTAKGKGYTTSVVWLEIDPDYSIARDQYRGETEGRSVGEQVIRSYVPKLTQAYKTYMAESELVDRFLHFRWDGGVVKGEYRLVQDMKRYPRKRKQKMKEAAQVRRQVIATLLRAGRTDLANRLAYEVRG